MTMLILHYELLILFACHQSQLPILLIYKLKNYNYIYLIIEIEHGRIIN